MENMSPLTYKRAEPSSATGAADVPGRPSLKPLFVLRGEIKSPPLSKEARQKLGRLLRRVQSGEMLLMPESRPMPGVGRRCHELRASDKGTTWRVMYRVDPDAVLVIGIFKKKTQKTPGHVMEQCRRTLARFDAAANHRRT